LIVNPISQNARTAVRTVTSSGAGYQTPIDPAAENTVENTESVEESQLGTVITGSVEQNVVSSHVPRFRIHVTITLNHRRRVP
jgi:hypothetical protein